MAPISTKCRRTKHFIDNKIEFDNRKDIIGECDRQKESKNTDNKRYTNGGLFFCGKK